MLQVIHEFNNLVSLCVNLLGSFECSLQINVVKSLEFFYPLFSRSSLLVCATILGYAFEIKICLSFTWNAWFQGDYSLMQQFSIVHIKIIFCLSYLECLISRWLVFCVVVLHCALENQNLCIILKIFDFKVISALCNNLKCFQYYVLSKCFVQQFWVFNKVLNVLYNNFLCFQIMLGMFDFKVINVLCNS